MATLGVQRQSTMGREGLAGFVHAFVVVDRTAVADHEADALAAVMRRTAAQGDQAVATVALVSFGGFRNVFIRGVGHGLVVHGILHAGGVKDIGDQLQDAHGHDALVGDDQWLLAAEALQAIGNLGGAVLADQSHGGDEEGRDLAHMHALDIRAHCATPWFGHLNGLDPRPSPVWKRLWMYWNQYTRPAPPWQ